MPLCKRCHRDMGTLNIVYCSMDCRKGIARKGSGKGLNANDMKMPRIEVNKGLRRPYGNKELM